MDLNSFNLYYNFSERVEIFQLSIYIQTRQTVKIFCNISEISIWLQLTDQQYFCSNLSVKNAFKINIVIYFDQPYF